MATNLGSGEKVRYGSYWLLRRLGKGGMAELFLASPTQPGRDNERLVIKRLLPQYSEEEEFLRMFLQEARLASQLAHPSIVRIFDLGLEGGHLYIAMEYIDGFDLESLTRPRKKLLAPAVAARIAVDVCAALAFAHHATDLEGRPLHVVHRDVTPENIMLSRRGEVKLIDFGVAKATAHLGLTRPGVVKGKLSYMAPEHIQGKELDGRADLFSLGSTLYELTTGFKPFERAQMHETLNAILKDRPAPPEQLVPTYPAGLSAIVMRALEKDRERRFTGAREMRAELERFLGSAGRLVGAADLAALVTDIPPRETKPPEARAPEQEPKPAEPKPPTPRPAARPDSKPPFDVRRAAKPAAPLLPEDIQASSRDELTDPAAMALLTPGSAFPLPASDPPSPPTTPAALASLASVAIASEPFPPDQRPSAIDDADSMPTREIDLPQAAPAPLAVAPARVPAMPPDATGPMPAVSSDDFAPPVLGEEDKPTFSRPGRRPGRGEVAVREEAPRGGLGTVTKILLVGILLVAAGWGGHWWALRDIDARIKALKDSLQAQVAAQTGLDAGAAAVASATADASSATPGSDAATAGIADASAARDLADGGRDAAVDEKGDAGGGKESLGLIEVRGKGQVLIDDKQCKVPCASRVPAGEHIIKVVGRNQPPKKVTVEAGGTVSVTVP